MPLTNRQIEELHDKQALYDNLMLYCRGADRYDIELMRSTYWPDATEDHGAYIGTAGGWCDMVKEWRQKTINTVNHHVSNVLCEIDGNLAKREAMFLVVNTFKGGDTITYLGGRYRDLCEKREAVWKLKTRVCIWDWCDERKMSPGWEKVGVPNDSNWGTVYPADPIYKSWL